MLNFLFGGALSGRAVYHLMSFLYWYRIARKTEEFYKVRERWHTSIPAHHPEAGGRGVWELWNLEILKLKL